MGLFDSVVNALGGEAGIAGNLEQLAGHLDNGGLQDIVSKFEQGGLSDVVQSWVGTGGNLPISPEQLESVLGSEQVSKLAGSLGIDTSQLATALPGLINHVTPDGQVPEGGIGEILGQAANSGALGNLLGGLFKA